MSAPVNQIPFDEGSFLDVKNPDLMQRVAASLHDDYMASCLLAERQTQASLAAAAKIEHIARDGWAEEFTMEVPKEAYFYWVQKLGPDIWRDEHFVKSFLRDNPQCKRITKTGRCVITNPGMPGKVQEQIAENARQARQTGEKRGGLILSA